MRYLAGASLLILPLWPHRKHDGLYLTTVLSVVVLPLLYIGSLTSTPGIWGFNELTLKGGILYSLILGGMWYEDWRRICRAMRVSMTVRLVLTVLGFLDIQLRSFNPLDCRWMTCGMVTSITTVSS